MHEKVPSIQSVKQVCIHPLNENHLSRYKKAFIAPFSVILHVFLCLPFLVIFFEKFFRVQTDWIKIRPNNRLDLGPSYLQRSSADDTRKVGKRLTNISIVSFLRDIVKHMVPTIRVQTVWI